MVVTVTSMKGGVGKTTIAALLARYLAGRGDQTILVVDMDPQGGASSLLLGGRMEPPTLADVLQLEAEGIPCGDLMGRAVRRSPRDERLLILPGDPALAALANSAPPLRTLDHALKSAPFPENTHAIVDTGTHPTLVAMGILAAEVLLIPVMLSQQSALPTIHTLRMALHHRVRRGALIPVGIGHAQWEARELARWEEKLAGSRALAAMGFEVLPGLPFSRTLLRGRWRNGRFPARFIPAMESIRRFLFEGTRGGASRRQAIAAEPLEQRHVIHGNGQPAPQLELEGTHGR